MPLRFLLAALISLAAPAALRADAPATRPAADTQLWEIRATQAFNAADYATALPMFEKLAGLLKDQPDRLGPINEKIRLCQRKLKRPTAAGVTPTPRAEARKPHVRPADGQVLDLDIKDLGNFNFDPAEPATLPADVKALDGVQLRTHGFMMPLSRTEHFSEFALVPSLFACCFGQPPQLQHLMVVHCPAGKSVNFFPDEIVVQGKLTVREKKDDGYVVSLFEMEASSIKPAK